jgi:hypothetical protein
MITTLRGINMREVYHGKAGKDAYKSIVSSYSSNAHGYSDLSAVVNYGDCPNTRVTYTGQCCAPEHPRYIFEPTRPYVMPEETWGPKYPRKFQDMFSGGY